MSVYRAPVYLDCAATTPIDPRVLALMQRYLAEEHGNPGSRTHVFGDRARQAVERARDQVAAAAGCSRGEVVFTSGATESCNLALLGLATHGDQVRRRHVVSTAIEHAAVIEPLAELERRGFAVTRVSPAPGGWVDPQAIADAVRDDTLLVSVMQVNNETGVIQPIEAIADALRRHPAYLHVDAAQGFARLPPPVERVDMISLSAHKLHGPKGVGALMVRRRRTSGRSGPGDRPPLTPLMRGGGQELGLRPGTLAPHQIVGLGLAAELATAERDAREVARHELERALLDGLASLAPQLNGDPVRRLPGIVNLSLPGVDATALIDAWRELVAISDGAACSTASKTCSHVLTAMGLDRRRIDGAVRLSCCHTTPAPDIEAMVDAARPLVARAAAPEAVPA